MKWKNSTTTWEIASPDEVSARLIEGLDAIQELVAEGGEIEDCRLRRPPTGDRIRTVKGRMLQWDVLESCKGMSSLEIGAQLWSAAVELERVEACGLRFEVHVYYLTGDGRDKKSISFSLDDRPHVDGPDDAPLAATESMSLVERMLLNMPDNPFAPVCLLLFEQARMADARHARECERVDEMWRYQRSEMSLVERALKLQEPLADAAQTMMKTSLGMLTAGIDAQRTAASERAALEYKRERLQTLESLARSAGDGVKGLVEQAFRQLVAMGQVPPDGFGAGFSAAAPQPAEAPPVGGPAPENPLEHLATIILANASPDLDATIKGIDGALGASWAELRLGVTLPRVMAFVESLRPLLRNGKGPELMGLITALGPPGRVAMSQLLKLLAGGGGHA